LRDYSDGAVFDKKFAMSTVENCISALRFPYKKTLKRRDLAFDDLPFRKQPHKLLNWWVFISHAAVHSEVRY
jgi:hypothetical protein